MLRTLSLVVLIACAVISGCRGPVIARVDSYAPIDAEIYALVLDSLFINRTGDATRRLILRDSTTLSRTESLPLSFWEPFLALTAGDTTVVRDFQIASGSRRSLAPIAASLRQRVRSPVDFVSGTRLMQVRARADSLGPPLMSNMLREPYWQAFYATFPAAFGSTSVSAIGYGQTGATALLYVDHRCGELCGEGNLVLLARRADDWRILKIAQLWIS